MAAAFTLPNPILTTRPTEENMEWKENLVHSSARQFAQSPRNERPAPLSGLPITVMGSLEFGEHSYGFS